MDIAQFASSLSFIFLIYAVIVVIVLVLLWVPDLLEEAEGPRLLEVEE